MTWVTTPDGQKVELCLDAPKGLMRCPIHKQLLNRSRSGRKPEESFRYCSACWLIDEKLRKAAGPVETPKLKIMKI